MFYTALLVICALLGSASGSSAVEEAYDAVVSVVSPGQRRLTSESLRTVFNTLEKRVQCGEVSCGKVRFISAPARRTGETARCDCAQGRGPNAQPCFTCALGGFITFI